MTVPLQILLMILVATAAVPLATRGAEDPAAAVRALRAQSNAAIAAHDAARRG
jgi:hypothetical protein